MPLWWTCALSNPWTRRWCCLAASHDQFVTRGQRHHAAAQAWAVNELLMAASRQPVLNLGLPDRFIEQGTQDEIYTCWAGQRAFRNPHRELAAGLTSGYCKQCAGA